MIAAKRQQVADVIQFPSAQKGYEPKELNALFEDAADATIVLGEMPTFIPTYGLNNDPKAVGPIKDLLNWGQMIIGPGQDLPRN